MAINFNPPAPPAPSGGGNSSGGSSTSSSTSEARAQANARAAFSNTLALWGIKMTNNLKQLINKAGTGIWGMDRFIETLRRTPEYRKHFVGIRNKNGTMKMSEAQYMNAVKQYEGVASKAGLSLNRKQIGWLFKNNQTPDEFADRAVGLGRINRNPDLYAAFRAEAIQAGAKPTNVQKKDMFKFVMGRGNPKWYDLWEDAVARNAAQEAGVTFKKGLDAYSNLGQGVIERVSRLGLSEDQVRQGFTQVEDQLNTVLSMTEAQRAGLSKDDIVKAVFGGKGAGASRRLIKQIVETNEAFFEDQRAVSQTVSDQEGDTRVIGGESRRPQY